MMWPEVLQLSQPPAAFIIYHSLPYEQLSAEDRAPPKPDFCSLQCKQDSAYG